MSFSIKLAADSTEDYKSLVIFVAGASLGNVTGNQARQLLLRLRCAEIFEIFENFTSVSDIFLPHIFYDTWFRNVFYIIKERF